MNKEEIYRLKIDLKFDINLPQIHRENFKSYLNEIQLFKMFDFCVGREQLNYLMNSYMLKDFSAFPHFFLVKRDFTLSCY